MYFQTSRPLHTNRFQCTVLRRTPYRKQSSSPSTRCRSMTCLFDRHISKSTHTCTHARTHTSTHARTHIQCRRIVKRKTKGLDIDQKKKHPRPTNVHYWRKTELHAHHIPLTRPIVSALRCGECGIQEGRQKIWKVQK